MKIMSFMRNDYHFDPDLFDIFVKEGVFEDYAKKYVNPKQIDEVEKKNLVMSQMLNMKKILREQLSPYHLKKMIC